MASKQKAPVVVAELGRPETASETAARKAEQTRLYKKRKTVNNLVFSLIVSLGLMFVLVLVVPRGTDQWSDYSVNVADAAEQNLPTAGTSLVAPEVPDTWKAKLAEVRTEKGSDVVAWNIHYTTENEAYAAVTQAHDATGIPVDEDWIATRLEAQEATGTERIGGLTWTVYDHPNRSADESNVVFGLQAQLGTTTLLVYGTDTPAVLRTLAAEVASQAQTLDLEHTSTTENEEDAE